MAKIFYTLEESATRLGMSEDEVRALAESGQLQEFRDRDRLMFKVEQVDLLAGGDDEDEEFIPLADSGELEPMSLSSSGSGSVFAMDNPKESTGISIFDPDETEEADPAAQTQMAPGGLGDFAMDSAASGSGLMDFARDADDTSLGGGNLLEDISFGDDADNSGGMAAANDDFSSSDALFEPAGGESDVGTAAAPVGIGSALAEPYDGAWSGLAGGIAVAMFIVLLAALAVMILTMSGAAGDMLGSFEDTTVFIVMGAGAVLVAISAIVGWVLLRRS